MRGFRFRLRRSCLRPSAEHVSACGRRNEASRRTREKTSDTQGNGLIEALRPLRMTMATNSECVVLTKLESYKQYS